MFWNWLRKLFGGHQETPEAPVRPAIVPEAPVRPPEPIAPPQPPPAPVAAVPEVELPLPEPELPIVKDMREIPLPKHAKELLADVLPWDRSEFVPVDKKGIQFGGVHRFSLDAGRTALLMTADADIDIDGPGGSKATDKYWLPETSLRWPDGTSCDSRVFPGVVVPGDWTAKFGVRKGDFAFLIWRGIAYPAQVYDFGPTSKVGEVSIALGRQSGIVPPSQSDYSAATNGNNATDVVYLIFPKSGPSSALSRQAIADATSVLWRPGEAGSMLA